MKCKCEVSLAPSWIVAKVVRKFEKKIVLPFCLFFAGRKEESLAKQKKTIEKCFISAPGVFEERVNDRSVFSPYRQQCSKICTECQEFLSLSADKQWHT